jgi:hypothetical protein
MRPILAGLLLVALLLVSCVTLPATGAPAKAPLPDEVAVAAQHLLTGIEQAVTGRQFRVLSVDKANLRAYLAIEGTPLVAGDELDLVQLGDPLRLHREIVGYEEIPLGQLVWDHSQGDKLGVCTITQLTGKRSSGGSRVAWFRAHLRWPLALVPGVNSGQQATQLGLALAQQLELALKQQQQYRESFVGVNAMRAVMAKAKLSLADLYDPQKAPLLAQLCGAKTLALPMIQKTDDLLLVTLRLVNLETGAVADKVFASLPATPELVAKAQAPAAWPVDPTQQGSAKLFDAMTPLCQGKHWTSQTLGTCLVCGKLQENCTGYQSASGSEGYVVFDVGDCGWQELRASCASHELDAKYRGAHLRITCDGKVAFDGRFMDSTPLTEVRVPLAGVRALRIDLFGGLVVPGDFRLVQGGGVGT